jgi:hypothetical protein
MKTMKWLWVVLVLAGCGSGGGDQSPKGAVSIQCVGVYNVGAERCITNVASPTSAAASSPMDLGDVTLGNQAQSRTVISNSTLGSVKVFINIYTDLDCNGKKGLYLLSEGTATIPPAQTFDTTVGFSCGNASLGPHVMNSIVYAADRTTVLDQVNGEFTLVSP